MRTTPDPVVLIGLGEMGSVFARGLLRLGHPVYPVTRDSDAPALAQRLPDPALVLVAVGEKDLPAVLEKLPAAWHARVALLQNELLPGDYTAFPDATVISVWFEKKPGQEAKVIIPSPVYGPAAALLDAALDRLGIPVKRIADADAMLDELVVKNLYILTSNIAGLQVGGTVGELWARHRALAEDIIADVLAIQAALTGREFDAGRLTGLMLEAFAGDPDHKCMGRSAPARLARALEHAARLGLETPTLRRIAATHGDGA